VAPQLLLLGLRQALVDIDPWGVPDQLLVVGNEDIVVALEGLGEGDEAGLGAEQAGVDQSPLGLPGPIVEMMASMVPMRLPSRSSRVRPCQVRTVSVSGI
jgi:hypothetical protein